MGPGSSRLRISPKQAVFSDYCFAFLLVFDVLFCCPTRCEARTQINQAMAMFGPGSQGLPYIPSKQHYPHTCRYGCFATTTCISVGVDGLRALTPYRGRTQTNRAMSAPGSWRLPIDPRRAATPAEMRVWVLSNYRLHLCGC